MLHKPVNLSSNPRTHIKAEEREPTPQSGPLFMPHELICKIHQQKNTGKHSPPASAVYPGKVKQANFREQINAICQVRLLSKKRPRERTL